jgi:hypothetical protein
VKFFQGLMVLMGLLFMISLMSMGSVTGANRETVICEDGDEFLIKERGIMEASDNAIVKGDLIIIDTRKLRLTLYRNGRVFRTYPVAIGESATPTPIGEWKIIHKGGNWGDGFGARWMGINVPWGIYGIHGTNKPWTIGSRASHGCIRMFNPNVLELYELVKLGTPVYITGDIPKVIPRREISRKNTGRDVIAIQFRLRSQNFDPGVADGRFGETMERAIYKLQRLYGLPITGKIFLNEQYLLKIR